MNNFKNIILNYNTSNISNNDLLNAIANLYPALDFVEEHSNKLFWSSMRKFHEEIKGAHFDECYAKYQVSVMYHTKPNGTLCKGEVYNIDEAKTIYEQYVKPINCKYTCWDVYVALNAQYHDYIKLYTDWYENISKEQLDERIIKSAIAFWFRDEDAGDGKVWNYFKNIG